MNTPNQVQLKISLSQQLNNLLVSKAARLGLPVTQFVKHLIIKEVDEEEYPVYEASARTERKTAYALKNIHKSVLIDDISEYFKNLK